MKIFQFLIVSILFVFFLTSNAFSNGIDAKINASSLDIYKKSVENIKKKLTAEEAKMLDEALTILFFPEIKDGNLFSTLSNMSDTSGLEKKFLRSVNGKSARQVIALANQRTKERKKKELQNINAEIVELEKKKKAYEDSRMMLESIKVTDAKYYMRDSGFMKVPIIDFKVTNETSIPLSRIFFYGTVATPGRTIPWISEDFNHTVRGGLEPGEHRHLQLNPNMFSGWAGDFDQEGSILTIDVINAMDAKDEYIAAEYNKKDEERLLNLIRHKSEIETRLRNK